MESLKCACETICNSGSYLKFLYTQSCIGCPIDQQYVAEETWIQNGSVCQVVNCILAVFTMQGKEVKVLIGSTLFQQFLVMKHCSAFILYQKPKRRKNFKILCRLNSASTERK